jgi:WASH complex subunit 7
LVGEKQVQLMKEFAVELTQSLKAVWSQVGSGHQQQQHQQQYSATAVPQPSGLGVWSTPAASTDVQPPLDLWVQPFEQTSVWEVIKTDNILYNKITTVFAALMQEIDQLNAIAVKRFMPALALFGSALGAHDTAAFAASSSSGQHRSGFDDAIGDDSATGLVSAEGDAQVWMGRMWPLLIALSQFVTRAYAVVTNTMRQLGSLYHPQQSLYRQSYQSVHLTQLFVKLYSLLQTLITLDLIVASNEYLPICWGMYKRMIKTIKKDTGKYQVDEETLWQFEKLMHRLKGELMDGLIYQNCVEQEFDFPSFFEVRGNAVFQNEFFTNLKLLTAQVQDAATQAQGGGLGGGGGDGSWNAAASGGFSTAADGGATTGNLYVGACALFGLWFAVWRQQNENAKKLFKALWEAHKRMPMVHLYATACFDSVAFLARVVPPLVKATKAANLSGAKISFLTQLDKDLPQRVQLLYIAAAKWIVRMDSDDKNAILAAGAHAAMPDNANGVNAALLQLIHGGAKVARIALHVVKSSLLLHTQTQQPFKAALVPVLFECLHLVKAIEQCYTRHRAWLARAVAQQQREMELQLARAIGPVRARLLQSAQARKLKEGQLDQLAAATLALNALSGPPTQARLSALLLALAQMGLPEYLKEPDLRALEIMLARVTSLARLDSLIEEATNASFMFWYRDLLPIYLKHVGKHPSQANKLQYLFMTLQDAVGMLKRGAVHETPDLLLRHYQHEVEHAVKEQLLWPLCREIEKDLRLHVHSQYRQDAVNHLDPFKTGVVDMSQLLSTGALTLDTLTLNVPAFVTHYLDTTFYNLNTVALYDWQTYAEMRNLARDKYHLHLQEVHLPGQTLEQGLDVLEIMRNIHIFTSKYNYNLNNQIFVERSSENKTLNTINIQHVANSIRTHGTGIMNTTVNLTYQFLKKKFVVFSQFLFDEQIKASLFRDIRFFNENREQLGNRFPYDRADKFVREIRKLGVLADNLSYLDKFRQLITEIGTSTRSRTPRYNTDP